VRKWVIIAGIALAGCSQSQLPVETRAQLQVRSEFYSRMNTAQEAFNRDLVCRASVESKPQYIRFYAKLSLPTSSDPNRAPSSAQLADTERISDADISLGLRWYAETQQCSVQAIQSFYAIDPEELPAIFANSQREITEIILEVVDTKPTWGHINQRLADHHNRVQEAMRQWGQGIRQRLAAQSGTQKGDGSKAEPSPTKVAQVTARPGAAGSYGPTQGLAVSQTKLARSQAAFAKSHPRYSIGIPVKVMQCHGTTGAFACVLVTLAELGSTASSSQ
jgi:hypothetical protein